MRSKKTFESYTSEKKLWRNIELRWETKMETVNKKRLKNAKRNIIWAQIAIQTLIPIMATFQAQSAERDIAPPDNTVAPPWTQNLSTVAGGMASGNVSGTASNIATGAASGTVQEWLNQFGTARVNLNVDNNGNWDQSSVDLLTPIYDNKKSVWFTQFGLRAPDDRITGNFGTGVRTFYTENWMFGGNVFFDDDFTGNNRRMGFGAEAWTNYLKLSANTYVGTTNWHNSRDFDDYNEKPADGFDVRAEAYLPSYPQLGMKVMYEQYYGDKVALFDKNNLQSNPSAVTTGINYTPIPLISLAADYRRGQNSMDDTQFKVSLRYEFGRNLPEQLDPQNVSNLRTLAGSRYDLVERNNQIILQYQKKEAQGVSKMVLQTITDNSPADGVTQNTLQVLATNSENAPVANAAVTWTASGGAVLTPATSVTNSQGIATINLTSTAPQVVQVSAQSGSVSVTGSSHFEEVIPDQLSLIFTKNNSTADGATPDEVLATVKDVNGRPVSGIKVKWQVSSPASLKETDTTTNAQGQARAQLVSTSAGPVTVSLSAGSISTSAQGNFVANTGSAQITAFTVTTNSSAANGTTPNVALLTVKDTSGNPLANTTVTVKADKSTVAFGGTTSWQTNSSGQATVNFTDTVAETVTLTASLANGSTKNVQAQFVADSASAQITAFTVTTNSSAANGTTPNVALLTVKDTSGNPLANTTVTVKADKSTVAFGGTTSWQTNSSGQATVNFTDTVAETVTLTASLANGSTKNVQSQFVADSASAQITAFTVTTNSSAANGTTPNVALLTVEDTSGNPLANTTVTVKADKSTVAFGGTTSWQTNSSGQATVNFTDTVAETVTLTASLANGSTKNVQAQFVADATTAQVVSLVINTDNSTANGITANSATATVKDANGNIIVNSPLTWTSTSGTVRLSPSGNTDGNGEATVSFTDTTAETITLTATLPNGNNRQLTSTFKQQVIARVELTIEVDGYGLYTPDVVSAIAYDSDNQPVPGAQLAWTHSNGGGTTKINPATTTADGNGYAKVDVSATVPGRDNIIATATGAPGQPKASVNVAFTNNKP